MKYLVLLGRIFYSLIFIKSSIGHFSSSSIGYAAGKGVPLASIAVPLAGILALLGGLSILLGYKARWGAWLIVLFLVPVTVLMHNYWTITDTMMQKTQESMFFKNLSMLGGALLIAYFGAGPLSLDEKAKIRSNNPAVSVLNKKETNSVL